MKTYLTTQQLVDKVMDRKGTTFISFDATTDARLNKRGNPLDLPVLKISKVNGMIGYNYENSVRNQSEREGGNRSFEAAPRKWGKRIHPCIVEHKGEFYLTVKVERSLADPRFFDAKGGELKLIEVKPFMPAKGKSRQNVDKEVVHREYKISSIRNIRMGGQEIEVINK